MRLGRKPLVDTEPRQSQLLRFLVERIRQLLVIELKSVAAAARVGVAIPLPRVDAVQLDFALDLLEQGLLVLAIGLHVPIVVRRTVALAECPHTAGHVVNVLLACRHQPARQHTAAAFGAFQRLAVFVELAFAARHARNHQHRGLAVEEHLLDKVGESIRLGRVVELEAHVLDELLIAKADRQAVGEMGLHVHDEELALGVFVFIGAGLHGLDFVDGPGLAAPDQVAGQKTGGQPHAAAHEAAAVHPQLFGFLLAQGRNEGFKLLL